MAQTIVVGVGQSDEQRVDAISSAVTKLARDPEDTVVLAHAYDEDDADRIGEMLNIDPAEPELLNTAVPHNTAVKRLMEPLEAEGIALEYYGAFGESHDVLVDAVDELDADFLVVGGRERSPAGKVFFGSTAQRALLQADCPVVFVKADE
ncbi:universal stress protein [Halogeometricum limi]|uniref:Nucleotide-binding universal stress protein, UspA family n=1 Tax=Halogeometricum limi TaxID=555875 RepID=A0A1I6IC44_9EURY|nr:universal stress protein [Halogeometricum limi]SFR64278.1 Nucleotide-binding universal stress protein, UspA family [Halogeometricum limi]